MTAMYRSCKRLSLLSAIATPLRSLHILRKYSPLRMTPLPPRVTSEFSGLWVRGWATRHISGPTDSSPPTHRHIEITVCVGNTQTHHEANFSPEQRQPTHRNMDINRPSTTQFSTEPGRNFTAIPTDGLKNLPGHVSR